MPNEHELLSKIIERAADVERETCERASRALVSPQSFLELAKYLDSHVVSLDPPMIMFRGIRVERAWVSADQEPLVWAEIRS